MDKLAPQFINEAKRIRKEYLRNVREIMDQEPRIEENKKTALKIQADMESTVKSDLNEVRKSIELNNKLTHLEREINKIQSIIKPFYDNIEKLRTDTDNLYIKIKEKYPNIENEDIKNQIINQLDE